MWVCPICLERASERVVEILDMIDDPNLVCSCQTAKYINDLERDILDLRKEIERLKKKCSEI